MTEARSSTVDFAKSVADLEAELAAARDQQTAMAEVLDIISRSATDVQPVMEAVAERGAALCDADEFLFLLVEDGYTRLAARHVRLGSIREPYPTEPAPRETSTASRTKGSR